MNKKGHSNQLQNIINRNVYGRINPQSDKRINMIYDRYQSGKSIIIDDLRYLWLKDPKGFEQLTRNIVEGNKSKGFEKEPYNDLKSEEVVNDFEYSMKQKDFIDVKLSSDASGDGETLADVSKTITSIKLLIENMNEKELSEMLNNINEAVELKKLSQKMKYWDDIFLDKMVMHTYDKVKEFDIVI